MWRACEFTFLSSIVVNAFICWVFALDVGFCFSGLLVVSRYGFLFVSAPLGDSCVSLGGELEANFQDYTMSLCVFLDI